MHPVRRQRLVIVLFLVVFSSAAIGLVVYALRGNINLFFPPAEVAAGNAPIGQPIRVGGMVVEGSVRRGTVGDSDEGDEGDDDSLLVSFQLTDYSANVDVRYEGILPDLFGEGQGAVASGVLSADGTLMATEVLAKHDENYMPPEVAEALEQSGYDHQGRLQ